MPRTPVGAADLMRADLPAVLAVQLDPGVRPNTNGLPGLPVLQQIVGALLTWGLLACLAGLVVSVMVWALAHHQGNYAHASSGKTGVLVAAGGALLIGGANAIIAFFSNLGAGI